MKKWSTNSGHERLSGCAVLVTVTAACYNYATDKVIATAACYNYVTVEDTAIAACYICVTDQVTGILVSVASRFKSQPLPRVTYMSREEGE
jgi:hypothetical protein